MKYILIMEEDYFGFLDKINKYLDDGWELQGGVSVNNYHFYQAMVKQTDIM